MTAMIINPKARVPINWTRSDCSEEARAMRGVSSEGGSRRHRAIADEFVAAPRFDDMTLIVVRVN
jgi:hypothetical protein